MFLSDCLWLQSEACCGHALELVILRQLDAAAEAHLQPPGDTASEEVPGVHMIEPSGSSGLDDTADAVIADGLSLGFIGATAVVAALHETSPYCILQAPLGVTAAGSGDQRAFVFVLGVVDDHEAAVGAVMDAAQRKGLQTARVRVGRTAEFSSKIVHAVQSLHSRGRLSSPLMAAATASQSTATPEVSPDGSAVERCEMHFWVFCEWLQAAECLPTDSESCAKNQILLADGAAEGVGSYASRSRSALVSGAVVAALARSHGARTDARLTLVFADAALTVDASLIGKFLGKRGHGALTEHHVLCGLADAARSAKHAFASDFEVAWAQWGTKMAQTVTRRRQAQAGAGAGAEAGAAAGAGAHHLGAGDLDPSVLHSRVLVVESGAYIGTVFLLK